MIYYRPTDGDAHTVPVVCRPRTCFLMTQIGEPIPADLKQLRTDTETVLKGAGYEVIDADSLTTGRDFLLKIWELVLSVPLGIALLHEEMRAGAIANVFYEMGLMQAYGKETLIVKTDTAKIPSDFVRTEYVKAGPGYMDRLQRFLNGLPDRAAYYEQVANLLEKNPLLALDYLRRAYLVTGDDSYRKEAKNVFQSAELPDRSKNSVEMLLVSFLD